MSSGGFIRSKPPFPSWAGPAERLRYFLRDAIRAPSRHNAQPWLFEIDGDELRVQVDARRALKAADPSGREAAIACGAAFENLVLSAAHHGYDVQLKELAPRGRSEPLAIARLGERRAPTPDEELLFGHIALRRTATLIGSEAVAPGLLAPLAQEMKGDATLRMVPRWLARPVAELVWEADGRQWGSPKFRSEVATWSRGHRRSPGDGTAPLAQGRPVAPAGFLARLLRRTRSHGRVEAERRLDHQTRSLLLIASRDDGPREWFSVGRAMQRLLLRATASGLSVSFLSQPIEVSDVRRRLRRELGEPGLPQLLLRVGYGPTPRATPRRPVELVLRSFSTDVGVEVDVDVADLPSRA